MNTIQDSLRSSEDIQTSFFFSKITIQSFSENIDFYTVQTMTSKQIIGEKSLNFKQNIFLQKCNGTICGITGESFSLSLNV